VKGMKTTLTCASGWIQVPSPSIGNLDNNLNGVVAASPTDAFGHTWAVGYGGNDQWSIDPSPSPGTGDTGCQP